MKKRSLITILVLVLLLIVTGTVLAYTNPGSVSGGGQIIQAPDGTKRPDWYVVSFGGWLNAYGRNDYEGEWQVK